MRELCGAMGRAESVASLISLRKSPQPSTDASYDPEMRRARGGTLIVGGGFAGATLARQLGRRGATIVSRHNFMLYTPLLPEAASGTLEPRHVVVPLREMCPEAELVLGSALQLDRERRVVTAESHAGGIEIAYENCVVALGAEPRVLPGGGM
jgi:NADH dehydrogenase